MLFTTRNAFYLRISNSTVLPTYVSCISDYSSFIRSTTVRSTWTKGMFNGCRIGSSNSSYQTCGLSQLIICLPIYVATLRINSLLSKLKAEADIVLGGNASKKSTVDTHRGGSPLSLWHRCFSSHESFFRNIPILLLPSQNRSPFCCCESKTLKI
jgi:hypothetical protein